MTQVSTIQVIRRGPRGIPGPEIELRNNEGTLEWRVAKANPDPWQPLIDLAEFLSDSEIARDSAAESALAASNSADNAYEAQLSSESARDLAADWAEKGAGQDVNGVGTRSAKHHAGVASAAADDANISAGIATSKASIATAAAEAAVAARDDAEAWASNPEDMPVDSTGYSALHYAAKAAASALAAETFDPSSYYMKSEVEGFLSAKVDADALATVATSGAYSDLSDTPQNATLADLLSGEADKLVTADVVLAATDWLTLTDAATIAIDWQARACFVVTMAGNRTIGNPTNVVAGTTRYLLLKGNNATNRAPSFASNFKGDLPSISNVTNARWYMLTMVAIAADHIALTDLRVLGS